MQTTFSSALFKRATLSGFFLWVGALAIVSGCNKNQETASTTKDSTRANVVMTDTNHKPADTSVAASSGAIAGKALDGQKIFYNTAYGKIKVACASCHSDGQNGTKDTRLRAGHTLAGVTSRTSTWNGEFTGATLVPSAYGATRCAVAYMHKGNDMKSVMPATDVEALNAYYETIKSAPGAVASNVKINWVTPPAIHKDDPINESAANAAAKTIIRLPADPGPGKDIYDRTCAYCHALKEKKNAPALSEAMKEPQLGARSVRVGNEAMPFFTKDILSDQQVADVIAYIQQELDK